MSEIQWPLMGYIFVKLHKLAIGHENKEQASCMPDDRPFDQPLFGSSQI